MCFVLRVTLWIFFDIQPLEQQQISYSPTVLEWWQISDIPDEQTFPFQIRIKESENAQKDNRSTLIGKVISLTGWLFASWTSRLAATSVSMVAFGTRAWSSPTFAAKSGRVCTAAYCKAPTRLRSWVISSGVRKLSIWIFLTSWFQWEISFPTCSSDLGDRCLGGTSPCPCTPWHCRLPGQNWEGDSICHFLCHLLQKMQLLLNPQTSCIRCPRRFTPNCHTRYFSNF